MFGYDDKHAYEHICQSNLRDFLEEVKGMSEVDAKAFVRDHFAYSTRWCTFEDRNEEDMRGVDATVTFHNTVPHGGGKERVGFKATLRWRSQPFWSSYEQYANIQSITYGPDATTSRSRVFTAREHPGVQLANLKRHPSHQVGYNETRKFRLGRKGAKAIQAVCGPGWSAHEALVMLYAAVGVPYSDKHLECDGLAYPLWCFKQDWIEHYTRRVCKVLPAADGEAECGDEDYETDDSAVALESAVAFADEKLERSGAPGSRAASSNSDDFMQQFAAVVLAAYLMYPDDPES